MTASEKLFLYNLRWITGQTTWSYCLLYEFRLQVFL